MRAKWTGIQRPHEYFFTCGHLASIDPLAFTRLALPFAQPFYDYHSATCMLVDPKQVLSGTCREYEAEPQLGSVEKEMDWLDQLAERERFDSDTARYAQIGSLPLYIACEGKNRVSLYRKKNRQINALVTPTLWPEAHEMTIQPIRPFGLYGLCHNDELKVLPFADAVLPLLSVYGIKFGRSAWHLKARDAWGRTRAVITGGLMAN